MRPLEKRLEKSPSAVPLRPTLSTVRKSLLVPAIVSDGTNTFGACCVNCGPKPCLHFTKEEVPVDAPPHATRVCPTDAIHFSEVDRRILVTDACISCGLCVLRCPYGAIFRDASGKAATLPYDSTHYRTANVEDADASLVHVAFQINSSDVRAELSRMLTAQAAVDKGTFYPLIGSMLTALGIFTVVSRAGDTNNRMDAVAIDPAESMPIEIKSPTEIPYINVKAIRQAIENKVVITARNMYPCSFETSTLAIGYKYPNERSDVDELVEDVATAYGINVGLISFEVLCNWVWETYVDGKALSRQAVEMLRGRADARLP